jgi:hypothetical protein
MRKGVAVERKMQFYAWGFTLAWYFYLLPACWKEAGADRLDQAPSFLK